MKGLNGMTDEQQHNEFIEVTVPHVLQQLTCMGLKEDLTEGEQLYYWLKVFDLAKEKADSLKESIRESWKSDGELLEIPKTQLYLQLSGGKKRVPNDKFVDLLAEEGLLDQFRPVKITQKALKEADLPGWFRKRAKEDDSLYDLVDKAPSIRLSSFEVNDESDV